VTAEEAVGELIKYRYERFRKTIVVMCIVSFAAGALLATVVGEVLR
jgi:hypothetical protein